MTDREKLIELQLESRHRCNGTDCDKCYYKWQDDCQEMMTADCLIANGVTVQKWIPASEPPKPGCIEEYLVETNDGVRYLAIYDSDCKWKEWSDEYKVHMEMSCYKKVVRWMPLPPKEQ